MISSSSLLGFLHQQVFILIPHTLALVRLRRPVSPNFCGHLANQLLVDSANHNFGLAGRLNGNTFRHLEFDRMAEAKLQVELFALGLGTIAHANKLQLLFKTLADAVNQDRKSTRLNSSHVAISYAVFCLKKKINY